MNNNYKPYQSSYWSNQPMYNDYNSYQYPCWNNSPIDYSNFPKPLIKIKDYGPKPYVVNIEEATKQNNTFRTALWTGEYLQLTLMSINVRDDIGLEVHHDHDQFIRIEEGQGIVKMGDEKNKLDFQENIYDDYAIFIPAGKWHNLINTGYKPLKLYSIYAPPEHPHGTVHKTKEDAENYHKF
ncbi:cupin domain-containing protein [Alkalibaculum sporogenes]|nr:cupin domain-containing protein [Alkalibaculum sporogenes]